MWSRQGCTFRNIDNHRLRILHRVGEENEENGVQAKQVTFLHELILLLGPCRIYSARLITPRDETLQRTRNDKQQNIRPQFTSAKRSNIHPRPLDRPRSSSTSRGSSTLSSLHHSTRSEVRIGIRIRRPQILLRIPTDIRILQILQPSTRIKFRINQEEEEEEEEVGRTSITINPTIGLTPSPPSSFLFPGNNSVSLTVLLVRHRKPTVVQLLQRLSCSKSMGGCWDWPALNFSKESNVGADKGRVWASLPCGQELMSVLTDWE
ncbi:hypothetical protein BST61_g8704 [Cercospora zeina]